MPFKECAVAHCRNNTADTPHKIFLHIPQHSDTRRKKWLQAIGYTDKKSFFSHRLAVCEDHFDLPTDAENWMFFKTIGTRLKLHSGVVPHKNLQQPTIVVGSQLSDTEKQQKQEAISRLMQTETTYFLVDHLGQPLSYSYMDLGLSNAQTQTDPVTNVAVDSRTVGTNTVAKVITSSSTTPPMTLDTETSFYLGLPAETYALVKKIADHTPVQSRDILITLKKIQHNDEYTRLGVDFRQSATNIQKIFISSVPKIANYLQTLIYGPKLNSADSIVDCLELEIEGPSDPQDQALTWAVHKSSYTLKYLVSITPTGIIHYVSTGFGGSTTDKQIVEKSGYLQILLKDATVTGDHSFKDLVDILTARGRVFIEGSSRGNRFTQLRVQAERVMRRLRGLKMLSPCVCTHQSLVRLMNYVVIVGCSMVNVYGPLKRWLFVNEDQCFVS